MNTIASLLYNELYKNFTHLLGREFEKVFDCKINTYYNFLTDQLVTERIDNEDLTEEQYFWIEAFASGYDIAMNQLLDSDDGNNLPN